MQLTSFALPGGELKFIPNILICLCLIFPASLLAPRGQRLSYTLLFPFLSVALNKYRLKGTEKGRDKGAGDCAGNCGHLYRLLWTRLSPKLLEI